MGDLIDLEDYDDEERRFLRAWANGLNKSVEAAAAEMLEKIAENHKAITSRVVAAEVTDLALIRARKRGPQKGQ